mgnify:CR=1 FL=1
MYKNPNYQKNWRENNKEKLKIDRKAYYEKNKINQLEKQKIQYHKNKAVKKAYYQKNKERILAKAKFKYQENKVI